MKQSGIALPLILLVIGVLILALGGAGYFYFNQKIDSVPEAPKTTARTLQVAQTASPQPKVASDAASQTYENPFEGQEVYSNPFSEDTSSYTNPFENLQ